MDRFKGALEECELMDLGFTGDPFTWRNNNHRSERYIRERLDRAVANAERRAHFCDVRVKNGNHYHSDHRPVVITVGEEVVGERVWGGQQFCFEAEWVKEEQCAPIMENAWKCCIEGRAGSVKEAVGVVAKELHDWSRNILGDLEKRIKRVKKELEACRRRSITQENVDREHLLRYKLEK